MAEYATTFQEYPQKIPQISLPICCLPTSAVACLIDTCLLLSVFSEQIKYCCEHINLNDVYGIVQCVLLYKFKNLDININDINAFKHCNNYNYDKSFS